jgi:hypothetical protein
MHDGDFGGGGDFDGVDDPGGDGGPLDLNNNGTGLDEFVLFAAITEDQRRRKEKRAAKAALADEKKVASSSGCLLSLVAVALLVTLLAI